MSFCVLYTFRRVLLDAGEKLVKVARLVNDQEDAFYWSDAYRAHYPELNELIEIVAIDFVDDTLTPPPASASPSAYSEAAGLHR